jgi:hypothetical protein
VIAATTYSPRLSLVVQLSTTVIGSAGVTGDCVV